MSAFDTPLHRAAIQGAPIRANGPSAGPAARLLIAVALASAATGGLAALALEHLFSAVEPRLQAPSAPATTSPAPLRAPSLPAVNDVLHDPAEPPIEPPPAS